MAQVLTIEYPTRWWVFGCRRRWTDGPAALLDRQDVGGHRDLPDGGRGLLFVATTLSGRSESERTVHQPALEGGSSSSPTACSGTSAIDCDHDQIADSGATAAQAADVCHCSRSAVLLCQMSEALR